MISEARHKAQVSINSATVELYWETGHFVSERLKSATWGEGIIEKLVHWLAQENVSLQGFSRRGIYRMVQFYDTYMASPFLEAVRELLATTKNASLVRQSQEVVEIENSIVSALDTQLPLTQNQDAAFVTTVLTQISWSNHLLILSGKKSPQERLFYLLLAKKERLSYRELKRQIDSSMYERTTMGDALLSDTMKSLPQEVSSVFRDTYSLELLGIPSAHNEGDLQSKIASNLKAFFLEFGRDFTFAGEEFRLQVGNHDYFIDLLFYHRELRCLVAVELKAREFDPRDLGQLEFYLEALDRDVKKAFENPSIGILLCKEKDDTVVQYALSRSVSPAMIAEYNRLLPDKALVRQRLLELLDQEKNEITEGVSENPRAVTKKEYDTMLSSLSENFTADDISKWIKQHAETASAEQVAIDTIARSLDKRDHLISQIQGSQTEQPEAEKTLEKNQKFFTMLCFDVVAHNSTLRPSLVHALPTIFSRFPEKFRWIGDDNFNTAEESFLEKFFDFDETVVAPWFSAFQGISEHFHKKWSAFLNKNLSRKFQTRCVKWMIEQFATRRDFINEILMSKEHSYYYQNIFWGKDGVLQTHTQDFLKIFENPENNILHENSLDLLKIAADAGKTEDSYPFRPTFEALIKSPKIIEKLWTSALALDNINNLGKRYCYRLRNFFTGQNITLSEPPWWQEIEAELSNEKT